MRYAWTASIYEAGNQRLFLAKSQELLGRAPLLLAENFTDEAGRAACLAGFHAAQAFIFEMKGRSPKSHSGVQTQFAHLVKDEPAIDHEMRAFLGRAYNLKAIADYETGPGSNVTVAQASEAIVAAQQFVAAVVQLIPAAPAPSWRADES